MQMKKQMLAATMALVMAMGMTACSIRRENVDTVAYQTKAFSFCLDQTEAAEAEIGAADQAYLATYEKMLENDLLSLWFDQQTGAVAVADKRTGDVWYSNHPRFEKDEMIDPDSLSLFSAQLLVDYLDGQNFKQLDSYTSSSEQGTMNGKVSGNTLSVSYQFLDNKKSEDENAKPKELFTIQMDYTLDGESLLVELPIKAMKYQSGMPPLKITVLPHFGSSPSKENGYILLPDGSGGLLKFDSNAYSNADYLTNIYGFDRSLALEGKPLNAQQTALPVFGVKDGNRAFLAVIEDGEAFSAVQAVRAGRYSSSHEVRTIFNLFSYQNVNIAGSETSTKMIGIQNKPYGGSLRLRYAFLKQSQADWNGMAGYYRSYLMEKYQMKRLAASSQVPLNLELIGTISKLKSTLGIQYEGMEALTTTDQAMDILTQLRDAGIKQINLCYSGWARGGLRQNLATSLKAESSIGGTKGMRELALFAKENGIGLFPSVTLLTTPIDSPGFNKFSMGAKQIDQNEAEANLYDLVTQKASEKDGVISPAALKSLSEKMLKNITKFHTNDLCLNDLAKEVFADYTKDNVLDRQTTVNLYQTLLKDTLSKDRKVMINGANGYAVPYADVVVHAPFEDSSFDIVDEAVPFWQMVFHGLVSYAGSPINLGYEQDIALLRSIEYGGSVYFQLMAADGSKVKNTDFSQLCSNHYDTWKETVIADAKAVNNALYDVQSAFMISNSQVADGVYQTVYDNGVRVLVNYSTTDKTVDNLVVKAGSYAVRKG